MENKLDLDIQWMPGIGYIATLTADKNMKAEGSSIADAINQLLEKVKISDSANIH